MAKLMFVSHTNYDTKGKRVVCINDNTENTIYNSNELENNSINKLCGLTNSDVMAIKSWLDDRLI